MNCITKLNILLRLTNPDTIFVLYAKRVEGDKPSPIQSTDNKNLDFS